MKTYATEITFYLYKLLGLAPFGIAFKNHYFAFQKSKAATLYTIFIMVVTISLIIRRFPLNPDSIVTNLSVILEIIVTIVSYSGSTLFVIFSQDKMFSIIHGIQNIVTASKHSKKIHSNVRKAFLLQVLIGSLNIITVNIVDVIDVNYVFESYVNFAITISSYFTIFLWEISFLTLVYAVQHCYYFLNLEINECIRGEKLLPHSQGQAKSIRFITVKVSHLATKPVSVIQSTLDHFRLKRFVVAHSLLTDTVTLLNSTYSFVVLLYVACDYVILLSYSYGAVVNLLSITMQKEDQKWFLSWTLWSFVYLFKFLWLAAFCKSLISEANRTPELVHKLLCETEDVVIKEKLRDFSLQMLHRKVEFTAYGFFPLDYTLIYSIVGAVTSYLIILIQFKLSFGKNDSSALNNTCT